MSLQPVLQVPRDICIDLAKYVVRSLRNKTPYVKEVIDKERCSAIGLGERIRKKSQPGIISVKLKAFAVLSHLSNPGGLLIAPGVKVVEYV